MEDAAEEPAETTPLVADAGDSPFVAIGKPATLMGMGSGGAEPYTFAWSWEAGTITGADAPTAELDTTGLKAGLHTVSLTVTDSAGVSATDSVKVVIFTPEERELLDVTRLDPTPGALSTGVPGV